MLEGGHYDFRFSFVRKCMAILPMVSVRPNCVFFEAIRSRVLLFKPTAFATAFLAAASKGSNFALTYASSVPNIR